MNLCDPGTLKGLLGRHGISASKGLGQHFLVSRSVVDKIVGAFDGFAGMLEIGPGPGVLTAPLSERVGHLIALELDARMPAVLAESSPKADVRSEDALKVSLTDLLAELPSPRGLVSNLPYYITGPLLTRIADAAEGFDKAVLMMQKEVGSRVLAPPKSSMRGSLSVFLQAQFEIRQIASVSAGCFLPPPKVDSVVLEFIPLPRQDSAEFFRLVRVGFTQPRKTLANNLLGLGIPRPVTIAALSSLGLAETARPQEMSLDQWRALFAALPAA